MKEQVTERIVYECAVHPEQCQSREYAMTPEAQPVCCGEPMTLQGSCCEPFCGPITCGTSTEVKAEEEPKKKSGCGSSTCG